MNPTNDEINDALQRLDRALTPAPVLATKAVAEFRLDREKGEKPLPVATDHDVHGAKLLDVCGVETRARPMYAPGISHPKRPRRWWPWRRP